MARIPIIREDDAELLGYVEKNAASWTAQTVFGYVFARSDTRQAVEEVVRSQGLLILQGIWRYYDKKDGTWYPCILKEAFEHKVVVIRTNDMGYQDPDISKHVTIVHPTETMLVKD